MLITYLTGLTLIVVMLIAWISVQRAWGVAFSEHRSADPDVLADRGGTNGCCGCTRVCDKRVGNSKSTKNDVVNYRRSGSCD